MKYRTVWKPGGNARRGMGSMKPGRKQAQAIKPKGTIIMKEVAKFGAKWKKAA